MATAQPQPGGPEVVLCLASTPSINPAWLDLPGTGVPTGTALSVTETCKAHHRDKVPAQGEDKSRLFAISSRTFYLYLKGCIKPA